MSNVRYLGMILAIIGLLSLNFHIYTKTISLGMFGIGCLFYAVLGYMENYQHKEIRLNEY